MTKKFMCLIAIVSAMSAVTLFAQEATIKAGEGTLMLDKKNYPLKHAIAYETTIDDEQAIAVVLSGQAVSSEQLKKTREAEKEGGDGDFNRRQGDGTVSPVPRDHAATIAQGARSRSATGKSLNTSARKSPGPSLVALTRIDLPVNRSR